MRDATINLKMIRAGMAAFERTRTGPRAKSRCGAVCEIYRAMREHAPIGHRTLYGDRGALVDGANGPVMVFDREDDALRYTRGGGTLPTLWRWGRATP